MEVNDALAIMISFVTLIVAFLTLVLALVVAFSNRNSKKLTALCDRIAVYSGRNTYSQPTAFEAVVV